MDDEWRCYDDVAEAYERYVVPNGYGHLAQLLVDALEVTPNLRVLDVGCGTGIAMRCLRDKAGPHVSVVGLDVSPPMLAIAAGNGFRQLVTAAVPHLPFAAQTFDVVMASLVLAHFVDPDGALRAMTAVLRPGGQLAVSAWGETTNTRPDRAELSPYQTWRALVGDVVAQAEVQRARRRVIPHEDRFASRDALHAALRAAGLTAVVVDAAEHGVALPTSEFVELVATMAAGRYLRHALGEGQWPAFLDRAKRTLLDQHGASVRLTFATLVASGRRP